MGIVPESDSKILDRLAKDSGDHLERWRLRARYVLSIGYSLKEASRIFSADEDNVYRWAERWNSERSIAGHPWVVLKPLRDTRQISIRRNSG